MDESGGWQMVSGGWRLVVTDGFRWLRMALGSFRWFLVVSSSLLL